MEKLRLRRRVKYLSLYNLIAILGIFALGLSRELGYIDQELNMSLFGILAVSIFLSSIYIMAKMKSLENPNIEQDVLKENEREYLVDAVHKNIQTIVETPVDGDSCIIIDFEDGKIVNSKTMAYSEYYRRYGEIVDVNNRVDFMRLFSKAYLLEHLLYKHEDSVTMTYGRIFREKHLYVRRTSTLIEDVNGNKVIYTYTEKLNDVSLVEAGYKDALLYMFDAIYSFNIGTYVCHPIFQKSNVVVPLPEKPTKEEVTNFIKKNVHPDDIRICREFFNDQYLSKIREVEDTISIDYRIRFNETDQFIWVRATIIFSKVKPNLANLYITNVDREYHERSKAKELLDRNEMMEHHMRMLSAKTMGKYYSWNLDTNNVDYMFDADGHTEEYKFDDIITKTLDIMTDEDEKARLRGFLSTKRARELQGSGRSEILDFHEVKDGHAEVHRVQLIYSDDPASPYIDLLNRDVTEEIENEQLKEANRELRTKERLGERFRALAEHTKTYTCEWRANEGISYIDNQIKEVFEGNYECKDDLITIWSNGNIIHEGDLHLLAVFYKQMKENNYAEMVIRVLVRKGGYHYTKVAASYFCDMEKQMDSILFTVQDVDEKVKEQNAATYRADFHILTGIYNLESFIRHVTTLLNVFDNYQYALVQLDVAHFKLLNEVYGRDHGDALLCHIANCLRDVCSATDCFARMNSDVFLICLHYENEMELRGRLEKLINNIESFPSQYKIMVSCGVYLINDAHMSITTMIDYANLALKEIKGSYLIKYYFYDDKIRVKMLMEKHMESNMQDALVNKEFIVYLQPKVRLDNGEIVGAEALVRWNHNGEIILPNQFIPLFEKNGFVVELDAYVWEEVCKIINEFKELGLPAIPISTNVSRMNIYSPDFASYIEELTKKYQIPQHLLELELTESVFLENPQELYNTMTGLQEQGFTIAMDDFGSGYSSLNMLRNVPIDILKIDKDFFDDKFNSKNGCTIIATTIELAHKLNLRVVAEGVETKEQREFLNECACDMSQGYLFSKPVSKEVFVEMLKKKYIEVE